MEAAMQVEDWMQNEDWFLDPEGTKSWQSGDITVTEEDKRVLRTLGEEVAAIASLPVQAETASKWSTLNGLGRVKPMVWMSDIPWHEMDVDGELRLQTKSRWSRYHEWELRKLMYQWNHMRADMVMESAVYSPLVVHSSGVGLAEDVDIAMTDEANSVVSRHFNIQIHDEADLEKIKIPVVTHDTDSSLAQYQQLHDIFSGLLDVKTRGVNGFAFWVAPWDQLIRAWGVQEALIDLYDRPELVHKAIGRLVDAYLIALDQFEQQNLLTLNSGYNRIGSGGLGYTNELPQPDYDPGRVRAKDLWGFSAAQIFSDVSPRMHWEFALQYEIRWLSRFGLNYYGCCDPLHRKMDILERIPNLRKVSMSPWVQVDEAVANVGDRYVFSYKPNPAGFSEATWHLDAAKHELETVLTKARAHGCVVEVIMKDISTLRYEPQRLWEWSEMAAEVTQRFAD
jgi:hypothetical protein